MEFIQVVGNYAGAIVTVIGLAIMIIKPIREWFIRRITKITKSDDTSEKLTQILESVQKLDSASERQNEALICVMRNTLMHLYYKYKPIGAISAYERENIEKLYKTYTALGGNSFVSDCVEEIRKMPTTM